MLLHRVEAPPITTHWQAAMSLALRRIHARSTRMYLSRRVWRIFALFLAIAAVGTLFVLIGTHEVRTSELQARYFSRAGEDFWYQVQPGTSDAIRFPGSGPYDTRLGYAGLPYMIDTAGRAGYGVAAQARISRLAQRIDGFGLFPIYREKNQAGLHIFDRRGELIYGTLFPSLVYPSFDSIPPVIWQTLLFIENRELLDERYPLRNPAIEWGRFSRAVAEQMLKKVGVVEEGPGASTLATQLEKLRHSPGGRTEEPRDKIVQMASASLRSYLDGENTVLARHRIVVDYLNALPLAAVRGYGEVTGMADGLWAWYGDDFEDVNRRLASDPGDSLSGDAFRKVVSLMLAGRRPSYYLASDEGRDALRRKTDSYIRIMAAEGVIRPDLRDAALAARPVLKTSGIDPQAASFVDRKSATASRVELLRLLDVPRLYDLDLLDASVRTTYDEQVQTAVADFLRQMRDPAFVRAAGLEGFRLLGERDPSKVRVAIVLYEAGPTANLLRIQADNFEGPFDINEGTKLELGSSAKLRTLTSYLQIIERLHHEYAAMPADELRSLRIHRTDRLSAWVRQEVVRDPGITLPAILDAALERGYSGSTGEQFFTGGGLHTFSNFSGGYGGTLAVREGFRHSVNLVFIRIMRDIIAYHMAQLPGAPREMLDDPADPRRQQYLSRFADQEGRLFLNRFYDRYQGQSFDEALETYIRAHRAGPMGFATAIRAIMPEAGLASFALVMQRHGFGDQDLPNLYRRADSEGQSWQDKGYRAGVHPLELWLLQYLRRHPSSSRADCADASMDVRQDVYGWLFKSKDRQGHEKRIYTLIEQDAFERLHAEWRQVGYPFETLVPSLATSIGSSADRPGALAELVGIIMRGGLRYPTMRTHEIHLAQATPYETLLRYEPPPPVRVLSEEVAAALRKSLVDVVENGTARRAFGALKAPDGTSVVIGGKTGTGDNRMKVYSAGGGLIGDRVLNRTSTLVFFAGDRLYGAVTTYVEGNEAGRYSFTSSFPAQILKTLGPTLSTLLAPDETDMLLIADTGGLP